jgi:site-specific DNA recombinase
MSSEFGNRPRAAIYARFSTDLQTAKSSEDQIHLCRAFAQREGYQVIATFRDDARSGASIKGREELQAMLERALNGEFDLILVESFDRMSRTMADMTSMFDRLRFRGVRIVGVHDGEATTINVGIRSMYAQMFREENVKKVRRGMSGQVRRGMTAGGKAYGYCPDPANPGRPKVVPDQAAIVLRIFEDYSRGRSPKAICRMLNAEMVQPPRGKLWSPSTLHGKKARGSGIFRNAQYAGKIVWNKVRMEKDPDTGKRVSRENPQSAWEVSDAPDLRIVPEPLFVAVQTQLRERSHSGRSENMNVHKRPTRLLSGLLKCGACGSGMSVSGRDRSGGTRLKCSTHTNSGACPDPKTYYLHQVEELVIDSLSKELASPEQIQTYAKIYMDKRRIDASREDAQRTRIEARIETIKKENMRLLDWVMKGLGDETEQLARMKKMGEERDRLTLELDRLPRGSNIVVLPTAIKAFAEKLKASRAKLHMTLSMLEDMGELSCLIREIVDKITLHKDADGGLIIEVESWLEPFIKDETTPAKGSTFTGAVTLVAEEGLEPPTRGL